MDFVPNIEEEIGQELTRNLSAFIGVFVWFKKKRQNSIGKKHLFGFQSLHVILRLWKAITTGHTTATTYKA